MTSSNELSAAWFPPHLEAEASTGRATGQASRRRVEDGEWFYPQLAGPGVGADDPEAQADPTQGDASYERGYADGMRTGMEKAAREIGPATEAMMKAAVALDSVKDEFLRDLEGSVHALAVAIARQLVQREVAGDPSITRDLVRRGLELLPQDAAIEVRLHPVDLAQLGEELATKASRLEGSVIRCIEDPSLDRGSFLLESPFRLIDGRIDHALRSLYEKLQHE